MNLKFALFEDSLNSNQANSYIFSDPVTEILVTETEQVQAGLLQLDELSHQGYYLAGYIGYDASFGLDKKLTHTVVGPDTQQPPLIHFIAYQSGQKFASAQLGSLLAELGISAQLTAAKASSFELIHLADNYTSYTAKFAQVYHHLEEGDSYQINLTLPVHLESNHSDLLQLYYQLSRSHPVAHAAFLPFSPYSLVSISPELFFNKTGSTISVRPMKGTAPRGKSSAEDQENFRQLQNDPKNLAENLIIVDLLRNDLAKFCTTGSVRAKQLFSIEKYQSVYQMTSSISASLAPDSRFSQIIRHLFPCGSITGAPKLRTMQLIEEIEDAPRHIYSGACGYILPNNDMQFNVAIRTLVAAADQPQQLSLGVGGGITIQANSSDEWLEIQTKLGFIIKHYQPKFKLVEAMLYADSQLHNLEPHLARLEQSAQQLGFICRTSQVQQAIIDYLNSISSAVNERYKLRIELEYNGNFSITTELLQANPKYLRLAIAEDKIDSSHPLFLHKTTAKHTRGLYDRLDQNKPAKIDELIFQNQHGYLTESRYHNLIIEYAGKWLTPSLRHGLLAGIFRGERLKHKQLQEADITPAMLKEATAIYLCNDVRGLIRAGMQESS